MILGRTGAALEAWLARPVGARRHHPPDRHSCHPADGRVSAVLGTHTHVPTADEHLLPGGTAFQCDVGMTGPYESILGRRIDRVLPTTITFVPSPFDVAAGDPRLAGAVVDVDAATGKAAAIRRIMIDEAALAALAPR